jgi:hypothetical protein
MVREAEHRLFLFFGKRASLQRYPKEFIKRIFKKADFLHVYGNSWNS